MGGSEITDEFLALACLRYQGNDDPGRYRRAAELLAAHPDLPAENAWVAAATADFDRLQAALATDADCASRPGGPRDWVPLLYLCYARAHVPDSDAPACLKLLLDAGADPNTAFSEWGCRFTALAGVMGEGEGGVEAQPAHPRARELTEALLKAGADPNDCQGLYNTMFRSDNSWLRLMLEHGLTCEHEINWDMKVEPWPRTLDFLLANAVDVGFVERIELLLEHGANPSATNPYNGRALHTNARLAGHAAIADGLLRAGATVPELTDKERFKLAILESDSAEARRLASSDPTRLADLELIRRAAQRGLLPSLELLVQLGANIDATDEGGVTALHHAAFHGQLDVIRFLLDQGADPQRKDTRHNSTPLGWGEYAGQEAAAALLRDPR